MIELAGHKLAGNTAVLAWSPNGDELAVAGNVPAVRLWDGSSVTATRTIAYWQKDAARLSAQVASG